MNIPSNLRYTKDHEWVSVEGKIATIGITDYAQDQLGDIVYIDIDTVGKQLAAEKVFGSVEAVKTVNDLFLPLSGTILEKNPALDANPELVIKDPYGEGWMIKLSVDDLAEFENLMNHEAYASLTGE
jgi:glycine cleavage system H protein